MNESLEGFVQECLKKWKGEQDLDNRLEQFTINFEEWLDQIPKDYQSIVLTLIRNLEYYSHTETNKWLKTLHSELLKDSNINNDNTIFAFIKSKYGKSNSSNDYWTEYKQINRINTNTCIENLDILDEEDFKYIDNIVFIDDFSGTGKSFVDELKKNPGRFKKKKVYFITINIMYEAMEKISKYGKENDIDIIILSAFKQEKVFKRKLFYDNETAKNKIEEMSKSFKIPENDILGYKKSQALIAYYNNTPNNTLGFIRYDTDEYKSIFPRNNDSVPIWMQMKKKRDKRKKTNYNNSKKGT